MSQNLSLVSEISIRLKLQCILSCFCDHLTLLYARSKCSLFKSTSLFINIIHHFIVHFTSGLMQDIFLYTFLNVTFLIFMLLVRVCNNLNKFLFYEIKFENVGLSSKFFTFRYLAENPPSGLWRRRTLFHSSVWFPSTQNLSFYLSTWYRLDSELGSLKFWILDKNIHTSQGNETK